jgi:hypothetical protein
MIATKKHLAALFLGLAVATVASPSFAQQAEDHMSAARAQALRECSALVKMYPQYGWGDTEITEFRDCMAQHGQQE